MSILFRGTQREFDNDPGWDKNIWEIEVAAADKRELATAICGFVPKAFGPGTGNFTTRTHELAVLSSLNKQSKDYIDHLPKYARIGLRDLYLEHTAMLATLPNPLDPTYAVEKAKADAALTVVLAMNKWVDTKSLELKTFLWPGTQTQNKRLDMRFKKQPALMGGTGFQFAKGFVMTASHCVDTYEKWSDYDAIFNFRCQITRRNIFKAPDPSETDGDAAVKYDKLHGIYRVVLRTQALNKTDPVDTNPYHDVGIIELEGAHNSSAWSPQKTLKLSEKPPVAVDDDSQPVHLIGHARALPLKYSGVWAKASDSSNFPKPRVLRADPRWPCFTASVDKFGGNSGGPLFDVANEVIGIVQGGGSVASATPNPNSPLWTAVDKWQREAEQQFPNTNWVNHRASRLTPEQLDVMRGVHWDSQRKVVTNPHALPWDVDHLRQVYDRNTFNRVDMYAGFCSSLQHFLRVQPRGFSIEMNIRVHAALDPATGESRIHPTAMEPAVHRSDGYLRCTSNEPTRIDSWMIDEDIYYTWTANFFHSNDLQPSPFSIPGLTPDFPPELFGNEGGMCTWRHIEIVTSGYGVEGEIRVKYAFDANTTYMFEVDLEFLRDRKNTHKWEAHIGEYSDPTQPRNFKGKPWKAPVVSTLTLPWTGGGI